MSLSIPPDLPKLKAQLDFVASYADLREDRASEILAQLGPQYAFWSSIVPLHPTRTKWTLELLDTALRLANYVEMRFKHALACPRPVLLSPQIQPIILTPGHGSLPSGHSTEAHMVASVLWKLCQTVVNSVGTGVSANDWCIQLMRQAARIAVNRTVAGVHFPIDSAAGQLLGLTLGDFFIARATGGQYNPWTFDGPNYPSQQDFFGSELFDHANCVRWSPTNPGPASPYAHVESGRRRASLEPAGVAVDEGRGGVDSALIGGPCNGSTCPVGNDHVSDGNVISEAGDRHADPK